MLAGGGLWTWERAMPTGDPDVPRGLGSASVAMLLLAMWVPVQTELVNRAVLSSPEGQSLPDFAMMRDSILAEAREIARGAVGYVKAQMAA